MTGRKDKSMTKRSVTHDAFTIERTYPVPPARVFAAYADPDIKARWFVGPEGWETTEYAHDFRVGGHDINRGGPPGGPIHSYVAEYQDIVPNERIVTTYIMHMDESPISVSLATTEFKPDGAGTRLIFTEQGAYLDGFDAGSEDRKRGSEILLDQLGVELERQMANV
jgi:uncharacterized protein YndB with AHSA1/START domain